MYQKTVLKFRMTKRRALRYQVCDLNAHFAQFMIKMINLCIWEISFWKIPERIKVTISTHFPLYVSL